MKINAIHLSEWMCHADTAITLNRLNIIVGLQYQGKTAILEAIQHALLGYSPRIPQKEVLPELDRGTITLDIEGLGAVVRKVHPNALQVGEWTGNLTAQQGALLNKLGLSADALEAALTSTGFISLPAADQKRMIFALSGLRFTADQVKDMVEKAAGEGRGDLSRRLSLDFIDHTPLGSGPEVFTKLYKDAFDSRRDAKRDLKKLEAAGIPAAPSLPNGLTPELLPEAQELLKSLRGERDELLKQSSSESQADELRKGIEEANARIAEIEEGIRSITDISDEYTKAGEQKKAVDDELRELVNDSQAAREKIAGLKAQRGALEAQARALGKFNGKCPLLSTFPCPADPQKIASLREDLREKAQKLLDQENKLVLGIETSEGKLAALQSEHLRLTERIEEIETEKTDRAALIKELGDLRKQVAEDEKIMAAMPDLSEVKEKIVALDGRIAEGEALIEKLRGAAGVIRDIKIRKADMEAKRKEVDDLEALVEILGPSGIVKDILAEKTGPIAERANRILGALTGGTHKLSFVFEPDFGIVVEINGTALPLRKLSHSQRSILVGICLQDALCQLTGLRFLAIDNAEMLDPIHRDQLTDFLQLVEDDYDQVMIVSTITQRDENGKPVLPRGPLADCISVFYVENGTVRKL